MATMKPLLRRIQISQIGVWFTGVLCGALLVVILGALVETNHVITAPVFVVTMPTETTSAVGGRLGGIANADTANDWLIRQGLNGGTQTLRSEGTPVIGGRLGGLQNADAPIDAAMKRSVRPEFGPGQGLNPVP